MTLLGYLAIGVMMLAIGALLAADLINIWQERAERRQDRYRKQR